MLVYNYLKDEIFESDNLLQLMKFPEKIRDVPNLLISPPFVDLHTHVRLNNGEDYETLSNAAIAGGFLVVNIQPNTKPPLDNLEILTHHLELSKNKDVEFCFTLSLFGSIDNIGELGNNLKKKVTGFSTDGIRYYSEDLVKAFAQKTPAMLFDHSQLHEIPGNFYIGTKLPNSERTYSNESIAIFRTVMTGLEFGFNRFHIQHVSTLESIETIRFLRKFATITCEVTPHHLYFTPDMIKNSNQKINPPVSKYRDLLIDFVKKGIIDTFATDHAPHFEKPENYQDAPYGSSHIEVSFSVYFSIFNEAHLVLRNLTISPLKILGKSYEDLNIRFPEDAILIDLQSEFNVDSKNFFSKGKNCAFDGEKLKGKVLGVRRNGRWVFWNGEFIDSRQEN